MGIESFNTRRLLYIGPLVEKIKNGGDVVNTRNRTVLKELFEEDYFEYILEYSENIIAKLSRHFFLHPAGLSPKSIKRCLEYIKMARPRWVFISGSQYGRLARAIKKISDAVIITYFHNIERKYAADYMTVKKPHTLLFYLSCRYNEALAVKYSDTLVCINQRDKGMMRKIYGRECDAIIPVTINDKFDPACLDRNTWLRDKARSKRCLFVGSNFFGNTQGLAWFIKEVLPLVNISLTIVGAGMSREFKNEGKITVRDYVDDLAPYYLEADFVILPIISGSGMKTKTAEALMYGKSIIGTKEAFEGYETGETGKLFVCQSKDDFIREINRFYDQNICYFNQDVRDLFLRRYATGKIADTFMALLGVQSEV